VRKQDELGAKAKPAEAGKQLNGNPLKETESTTPSEMRKFSTADVPAPAAVPAEHPAVQLAPAPAPTAPAKPAPLQRDFKEDAEAPRVIESTVTLYAADVPAMVARVTALVNAQPADMGVILSGNTNSVIDGTHLRATVLKIAVDSSKAAELVRALKALQEQKAPDPAMTPKAPAAAVTPTDQKTSQVMIEVRVERK
jgi:hypothetical protein